MLLAVASGRPLRCAKIVKKEMITLSKMVAAPMHPKSRGARVSTFRRLPCPPSSLASRILTIASGMRPAATNTMQMSHGVSPSMPVKGTIVGPTAKVTESMDV
jgi:hypothetical protein